VRIWQAEARLRSVARGRPRGSRSRGARPTSPTVRSRSARSKVTARAPPRHRPGLVCWPGGSAEIRRVVRRRSAPRAISARRRGAGRCVVGRTAAQGERAGCSAAVPAPRNRGSASPPRNRPGPRVGL